MKCGKVFARGPLGKSVLLSDACVTLCVVQSVADFPTKFDSNTTKIFTKLYLQR